MKTSRSPLASISHKAVKQPTESSKTRTAARGTPKRSSKAASDSSQASPPKEVRTASDISLFALLNIDTLAAAAANGEAPALKALYEIAIKATAVLNDQDLTQCQNLAQHVQFWPVTLSTSTSLNRTLQERVTETLGLAKALRPLFDMEAVMKRGAKTNQLASLLISFIEECRRFGVVADALKADPKTVSEAEDTLIQPFRAAQSAIRNVARFLNLEWEILPTVENLKARLPVVWHYTEKAVGLPALHSGKKAKDEWLELGMTLIRDLTRNEFQDPGFGLRCMNRRTKDGTDRATIRKGIRQGIKEGLSAVLANVGPDGFVKVPKSAVATPG